MMRERWTFCAEENDMQVIAGFVAPKEGSPARSRAVPHQANEA
jgi:hypothetical protein